MTRTFIFVFLILMGQSSPPGGFTTAQAEAGRAELKTNKFGDCSSCHASNLGGRVGDPSELPAVGSLSPDAQETIKKYGKIPALVGPTFRAKWGARSTMALVDEFKGRFGNLSEETRLNIIAFILQSNGAKPGTQPLSANTDVKIDTLTGRQP
jgi:hypothetical protein